MDTVRGAARHGSFRLFSFRRIAPSLFHSVLWGSPATRMQGYRGGKQGYMAKSWNRAAALDSVVRVRSLLSFGFDSIRLCFSFENIHL